MSEGQRPGTRSGKWQKMSCNPGVRAGGWAKGTDLAEVLPSGYLLQLESIECSVMLQSDFSCL